MLQSENNYAFIDSQNINLGVQKLGWRLDFKKFRIFLREKYGVSRAYLFIGYVPWNTRLYKALESYGYLLIFKQAIINENGSIKGNIDAELVLQAMIEYQNFDEAVIVSGDGDFACLVRYLNKNKKMKNVLVSSPKIYSGLLKRATKGKINFLADAQALLEYF